MQWVRNRNSYYVFWAVFLKWKNKILILSQLKLECYKNEIIKKHDFEKEKIYIIAYV